MSLKKWAYRNLHNRGHYKSFAILMVIRNFVCLPVSLAKVLLSDLISAFILFCLMRPIEWSLIRCRIGDVMSFYNLRGSLRNLWESINVKPHRSSQGGRAKDGQGPLGTVLQSAFGVIQEKVQNADPVELENEVRALEGLVIEVSQVKDDIVRALQLKDGSSAVLDDLRGDLKRLKRTVDELQRASRSFKGIAKTLGQQVLAILVALTAAYIIYKLGLK